MQEECRRMLALLANASVEAVYDRRAVCDL